MRPETLILIGVGVILGRYTGPVLVWLWFHGLGCALLDHDANLISLGVPEINNGCGRCYRCGGPLLSRKHAMPTAPQTTGDER